MVGVVNIYDKNSIQHSVRAHAHIIDLVVIIRASLWGVAAMISLKLIFLEVGIYALYKLICTLLSMVSVR